jgi:RNA polymerase sigma-70 factor (ECF subfamily)
MRSYQPYWAARGHLLAKIGANADAAEAYRVAIGLSTDEAVRAYLRAKLSGLQQG